MSLVMLWFGILLALMTGITGNEWLLIGVAVFWAAAALLEWLERVQERVVAELAKTCKCPLCKAARDE